MRTHGLAPVVLAACARVVVPPDAPVAPPAAEVVSLAWPDGAWGAVRRELRQVGPEGTLSATLELDVGVAALDDGWETRCTLRRLTVPDDQALTPWALATLTLETIPWSEVIGEDGAHRGFGDRRAAAAPLYEPEPHVEIVLDHALPEERAAERAGLVSAAQAALPPPHGLDALQARAAASWSLGAVSLVGRALAPGDMLTWEGPMDWPDVGVVVGRTTVTVVGRGPCGPRGARDCLSLQIDRAGEREGLAVTGSWELELEPATLLPWSTRVSRTVRAADGTTTLEVRVEGWHWTLR